MAQEQVCQVNVLAGRLLTQVLCVFIDRDAMIHFISSCVYCVECALVVPPWAIAIAVFIALLILGTILLALLKLIVYLLVSGHTQCK